MSQHKNELWCQLLVLVFKASKVSDMTYSNGVPLYMRSVRFKTSNKVSLTKGIFITCNKYCFSGRFALKWILYDSNRSLRRFNRFPWTVTVPHPRSNAFVVAQHYYHLRQVYRLNDRCSGLAPSSPPKELASNLSSPKCQTPLSESKTVQLVYYSSVIVLS